MAAGNDEMGASIRDIASNANEAAAGTQEIAGNVQMVAKTSGEAAETLHQIDAKLEQLRGLGAGFTGAYARLPVLGSRGLLRRAGVARISAQSLA